jgi:hypothetical protein
VDRQPYRIIANPALFRRETSGYRQIFLSTALPRIAACMSAAHNSPGLRGCPSCNSPRPEACPAGVFTAIEANALMPLPPRAFECVVYSLGRVAPDCHVKSGKALYSVPVAPHRPAGHGHLGTVVTELLLRRWSPQQISRHLRHRFPHDPSMWLCHESIYQAVYEPNSRFLRPSPLAPHRRSPLRTGRDHRRAHQRQQRRRPRFQQPMLTIHDRPFPVDDRSQAGHWEGDLIIGNNHCSAIATLVERQTRMVRLVHLHRSDADSLHAALVARMRDLPTGLMRSITLATRQQREHERTAARLLPQGRQPHPPLIESPARRRRRTQPPPTHGPPRPLPCRPIRDPASLHEVVHVATLTGTHPGITCSVSTGTGITTTRAREGEAGCPSQGMTSE